jgi:polyisoprenyl-phosphate glycosyltransferase
MDLSIIVPVYDGEKTLETLCHKTMEGLDNKFSFEILFIFDDGFETSWTVLKKIRSEFPDTVRVIKMKKNYGQHNATMCGIKESRGDLIITMDEDLMHDPGLINQMILKQKETKSDVVYVKFSSTSHSRLREIASRLLRYFLNVAVPGLDYYSSFRLIRNQIAKEAILIRSSYSFIDARLYSLTTNISYVINDNKSTALRGSTYGFISLLSHAVKIIIEYTPIIKWVRYIAFFLTVTGIFWWYFTLPDNGFAAIVTVSGILLLLLTTAAALYKNEKYRTNQISEFKIEKD